MSEESFTSIFSNSVLTLKDEINSSSKRIFSTSRKGGLGFVVPYELPDETSVEMPLSPVSKFAIKESGKYGPLNEKDLINFLAQKFDRRRKGTVGVIHTFSEDIEGVKKQLEKLRNRIEGIEADECRRSEFLHKMIRRVLAAVEYIRNFETAPDKETVGIIPGYQPPDAARIEEFLTPASKLAFKESEKIGPLNEKNLKMLLCDRLDTGWKNNLYVIWQYTKDVEGLIEQLEELRDHMDGVENIQRFRSNVILGQIEKALADIEDESHQ